MAEIIAKIDEVNSKELTSKKTGKPFTLTLVRADGREYSTPDTKLGKQAAGLRGQMAKVVYRVAQNGEYENYYLEGVEAVETTTISDGVVSHNITPILVPAQQTDYKSAQINRSVAFKAAVELVAAGVLTIDGVGDLDKLTTQLIPIVEGSYASGNHTGDDEPVEADLIKF